jgi:hypothetical protein
MQHAIIQAVFHGQNAPVFPTVMINLNGLAHHGQPGCQQFFSQDGIDGKGQVCGTAYMIPDSTYTQPDPHVCIPFTYKHIVG